MYGRLRRSAEKSSGGIFGGGLRTYTGAAINTPEEKYKKISFANMKDPYRISFNGGWIAMLEHYFVSAVGRGEKFFYFPVNWCLISCVR